VQLVRERAYDMEPPLFTGSSGNFAFRGVSPGRYRLEARLNWAAPDGTAKFLVAQLPLEVGSADLDSVELPLEPAATIDVILHGPGGEKVGPESVHLILHPAVDGAASPNWAQPAPPSGVRFDGLFAGSYRLVTRTNADESVCVESAKMGEQNVLNAPIAVTPGMEARMDVTVSSECGKIEARAVRDGKPVPGAKLVLLLNPSPAQPYDVLADYADEQGQVSFTGLRAGRYRLWAWKVDMFGAFVGPASLDKKPYTPVEVPAGKQVVTVDVPLLPEDGTK
jgi:hypothetical protein